MSEKPWNRPTLPIDWDRVDDLLEKGCLGTEIAAYFGVHPQTLYERTQSRYGVTYSEYSQSKKAKGELALREVQFDKATGKSKKGDNTMLIWLGKQRLNQKESIAEFTVSEDALKPLAAVMGQMSALQEERKRAATNDNSSAKSE